jgi:hypothetical protein
MSAPISSIPPCSEHPTAGRCAVLLFVASMYEQTSRSCPPHMPAVYVSSLHILKPEAARNRSRCHKTLAVICCRNARSQRTSRRDPLENEARHPCVFSFTRSTHTSELRRVCLASAVIVAITWHMLPCLAAAEVCVKHAVLLLSSCSEIKPANSMLVIANCITAAAVVGYLAARRVYSERACS